MVQKRIANSCGRTDGLEGRTDELDELKDGVTNELNDGLIID